jgi:hypothetical protein
LKQVKGVGTLIALTFLLTLEDPHRCSQIRFETVESETGRAWSQKTRLTERSLVRTIRVPRTDSIPSEAIRVYSSDSYLQRTISEAQQNWRNPVQ